MTEPNNQRSKASKQENNQPTHSAALFSSTSPNPSQPLLKKHPPFGRTPERTKKTECEPPLPVGRAVRCHWGPISEKHNLLSERRTSQMAVAETTCTKMAPWYMKPKVKACVTLALQFGATRTNCVGSWRRSCIHGPRAFQWEIRPSSPLLPAPCSVHECPF